MNRKDTADRELLTDDLTLPGGLAVRKDTVYISNNTTTPGAREILRLELDRPRPPSREPSPSGEMTSRGVGGHSMSMTTGTWSLGALPLRSSRWMAAPTTCAASSGEAWMKSMRMPSLRGKRRRW